MRKRMHGIRDSAILALLLLVAAWALGSAPKESDSKSYPNGKFLVSPVWLKQQIDDQDLIVLDVRRDENFDGRLIPGAV